MYRPGYVCRLLLALFLMASLPLRGYAVGMLVPPAQQHAATAEPMPAHGTHTMPAGDEVAPAHAAHSHAASDHTMHAHEQATHQHVMHEHVTHEHAMHEYAASEHATHEHAAHDHAAHDHPQTHAAHAHPGEPQSPSAPNVAAHHPDSPHSSHSSCGPCADCCSVGALQSLPLAMQAQPAPHRVATRPARSPASFIADLPVPPPNPLAA